MFENDIMGFREKVALVCLAVITFQTACVFSMPPIWFKKDSTNIFQKNNINTDNKLLNSGNILQSVKKNPQTILKSFNFPEVKHFPTRLANQFAPKSVLEESPNMKVSDHSEFLNNFRKEKRRKRKYGSLKMPDEKRINNNKQNFLSHIEAFPQMEFPLTASETWAPSFWNQLSFPLHDPYFHYDKNVYKPEMSEKLSNSMKKGKYTTNTKSKENNKIDLTLKNNNTVPIHKNLDVNVLQKNNKTFAKMIMPNTTTMLKLENDNGKPEDTFDNVPKTSKPKRKPKTRKIKIVTKNSNVLRDLIAKKSNTSICSVHNTNSSNNCCHKNKNETTSYAISGVINDRKNIEISDLLSDDFDVCYVNHDFGKTTNDDSQICVSFDHVKSTEKLLPVSNTVKLSINDSTSCFDKLLNHTIKTENNCSKAEPGELSKNVEKIVISDVNKEKKLEQINTNTQESISLVDNKISYNTSKQHTAKILSDTHNDNIHIDKPTTVNSGHLANYELLDEIKEIRELDTDIVLSNLEHAIVNSKIDGTIDILIPKLKQAILEAIVESAAFVPPHIPTGFSTSRQNVHFDKNPFKMNDVELIYVGEDHDIKSPDGISFTKEKYSVPNQTIDLNVTETLNLTKSDTNYLKDTLLDNIQIENKTLITSHRKSKTLNQDKMGIDQVFDYDTLLSHPTSDVIILKENEKVNKETEFNLTTTMDFSSNITDNVVGEPLKGLQVSDITIREPNATTLESNTDYINQNNSADLSTAVTLNNTFHYEKMPLVKILLKSINNTKENRQDSLKITAKNINNSPNEQSAKKFTVSHDFERNSVNNSVIDDVLDILISDQDNHTDKEIINFGNVTNKSENIYEYGSFTDVGDCLPLKQDKITSTITSSDTLKNNINSSETIYYNDGQNYSSINTLQEEQTTPPHDGNNLKENNNIYIDQSGWKMIYGKENGSQSLLNSDKETRIVYVDKQEDSLPQVELLDALDIEDNASVINHNFEGKLTGSCWLESNNTTPDIKLIPEIETLSESLSHEIKPNFSLRDHSSLSDEISSDEFTEQIVNAIIDILCTEDSESNNKISTNNTLRDNIRLTDYTSTVTNKEIKNNVDVKTMLNEDKNFVLYTEDENILEDDFGSVVSDLDSTVKENLPENIIFKNIENVDNASDDNVKVKISKLRPLLGTVQINHKSSQDYQDKEAREIASDKEAENELEHLLDNTKETKKTYLKDSPNNYNAREITKSEIKTPCTEEVADKEDNTTLNKGEKTPSENNVTENRIIKSMDDKLYENKQLNIKTAIDELLPDIGDAENR